MCPLQSFARVKVQATVALSSIVAGSTVSVQMYIYIHVSVCVCVCVVCGEVCNNLCTFDLVSRPSTSTTCVGH